MDKLRQCLSHNLAQVRERMAAACQRSQRDPASLRLVAVTKYAPLTVVEHYVSVMSEGAPQATICLGENRPQQLVARASTISNVEWHLIGHLQSNKARLILPHVQWVHSIDSLKLLRHIDELSGLSHQIPQLLLQVNVSGESSKEGFSVAEIRDQWPAIRQLGNVNIRGLMTMAPFSSDPESSRPWFRQLRQLRDELAVEDPASPLPELSMGMSGDFEVAIEEGATLVRLGSVLFEGTDACLESTESK